MKNALLLGATGMLSGLIPRMLADDYTVFVIGRDRVKLDGLIEQVGSQADRMMTMVMDYRDTEKLARWVAHLQLIHGPLDLVVAWIHGQAQPVLKVIGREVEAYRHSAWDLVLVQGIAGAAHPEPKPEGLRWVNFHTVTLGFCRDVSGSRWLTHREIVDGVMRAIGAPQTTVVGLVEPERDRPDA